jgi:CAAX prenyl protease-like protein
MPASPASPSTKKSLLALPETPRILPFAVFMLFTIIPASVFPGAEYWLYAAKTVAVAGLLWSIRRWLPEMKWAVSWEAVGIGILIAVVWLGLPTIKPPWELFSSGTEAAKTADVWNPLAYFAGNPALGWAFLLIRTVGRSLVVPAVEEIFYRGFVYRYVISPHFTEVALNRWHTGAFTLTSLMFGFAHGDHWLQGILCGTAYQWLVLRKARLGDAMLAHAITNLIISVYAVATNQWQFT